MKSSEMKKLVYSKFSGLHNAPRKETVIASGEAISVKGKLKRTSLDTSFKNDWELGFRGLTNDVVCLFWQRSSNAIF